MKDIQLNIINDSNLANISIQKLEQYCEIIANNISDNTYIKDLTDLEKYIILYIISSSITQELLELLDYKSFNIIQDFVKDYKEEKNNEQFKNKSTKVKPRSHNT